VIFNASLDLPRTEPDVGSSRGRKLAKAENLTWSLGGNVRTKGSLTFQHTADGMLYTVANGVPTVVENFYEQSGNDFLRLVKRYTKPDGSRVLTYYIGQGYEIRESRSAANALLSTQTTKYLFGADGKRAASVTNAALIAALDQGVGDLWYAAAPWTFGAQGPLDAKSDPDAKTISPARVSLPHYPLPPQTDPAKAHVAFALTGDTTRGLPAGTFDYHQNHLGSSSLITASNGVETTRIEYLPYGEIDHAKSPGTNSVTFKFNGQEMDDETGYYNYGARFYDPVMGSFLEADWKVPDPTKPVAHNRYTYVYNNPVVLVDPTGHEPKPSDKDGNGVLTIYVSGIRTPESKALNPNYLAAAEKVLGMKLDVAHHNANTVAGAWLQSPNATQVTNLRASIQFGRDHGLPIHIVSWSNGVQGLHQVLKSMPNNSIASVTLVEPAVHLNSSTSGKGFNVLANIARVSERNALITSFDDSALLTMGQTTRLGIARTMGAADDLGFGVYDTRLGGYSAHNPDNAVRAARGSGSLDAYGHSRPGLESIEPNKEAEAPRSELMFLNSPPVRLPADKADGLRNQ